MITSILNTSQNHLTDGLLDLVKNPYEGFQTSTLDGMVGIFSGAGSLTQNTIVGKEDF
jgi:hypothetical protein